MPAALVLGADDLELDGGQFEAHLVLWVRVIARVHDELGKVPLDGIHQEASLLCLEYVRL